MRTDAIVLRVVGGAMTAAGLACVVWALLADSELSLGVGLAGLAFVIAGPILFLSGRYAAQLDGSETVANGIAGRAEVLSVKDTGVSFHGQTTMVVKARVRVHLPDREPYEGQMRVPLGRTSWGSLREGMTIQVKVDPDKPSRIVLDTEGRDRD
jgi:hypothetical protein